MSAEFSNLAERIRILLSSRGVYTWQLNGECIYGLLPGGRLICCACPMNSKEGVPIWASIHLAEVERAGGISVIAHCPEDLDRVLERTKQCRPQ